MHLSHSLEDNANHNINDKPASDDNQLDAAPEVSTPCERRPMNECSVASSSAIHVSPNNRRKQAKELAIDAPATDKKHSTCGINC